MKKMVNHNSEKNISLIPDNEKIIQDLNNKIIQLDKDNVQLKNLVDIFPGNVYCKDINGVWLGLNKKCADSLKDMGFIKEGVESEVIGKTDHQLFNKKTAEMYRQSDMLVMEKKTEVSHEEVMQLISGEIVTLLFTKKPLLDKDGHVVGIVGNIIDKTYLKKIETELAEAKEKAQAASVEKTEFIANMSHDIRIPLSGIIGISSLLEQKVQTLEEKEYAHMVNISGEQLLALLNSVLEIIAANNPVENMTVLGSMNIKNLLKNLTELQLPTVTLKNIELKTQVDSSVPEWIITDPVKLHRILLNLLGNAIKFTNKGCVSIHVSCSIIDENAVLDFSVRDTGIGIKKDAQSKIFSRFYRVSPSHKNQTSGFGVGLHIVQHSVELLQGEVTLESVLGQGSTFKVRIPVKIDSVKNNVSQPIFSPSASAISPTNNKNLTDDVSTTWPLLLLVEDNPIALKLIESIAQQAHCRFISTNSGEQALELVKQHEFDLIVSDIGLLGISGYELSSSIREFEKSEKKAPCPIVGLSAHDIETTITASLDSGMNKAIMKPIRLETLKNLVHEFIPLSKNTVSSLKSRAIDLKLPQNEAELFQMEQYSVLDVEKGVSNLGSLSLLKELLNLMIHRALPEDIEEIKNAYKDNNWKHIEKIAHKIKSGALYCGTIRLKHACQYLEHYNQSGETNQLDGLYQQLCYEAEQTTKFISQWLTNNSD